MNGNKFVEILTKLLKNTKAFIFSRNVLVFLFFLIVSAMLWLTMALNKTYEDTVTLKINYINIPKDIEFSADLTTHIDVKVKDKGTTLLSIWRNKINEVTFDFAKHPEIAKSKKIVLQSSVLFEKQLKSTLAGTTVIMDYYPSEIVIEKGVLKSKYVPVRLKSDIECESQYCQIDSSIVVPAKVKVYATQERLDSIDCIYTKLLEAEELDDTLYTKVPLVVPENYKTEISEVDVTVPVEIFIEGSMNVPVKVINVPQQYRVRAIPGEVTVKYNVGKSRYKEITPSGFHLFVDYNEIIESEAKNQFINVGKIPNGIINYKLQPDNVEYVVY